MTIPHPHQSVSYARARAAARAFVDDYRPTGKLHPAVCTGCGASEWQGRWYWDEPPPDLAPVLCPACSRVRDGAPAHVLTLTGALAPHWQEVQGLLTAVERAVVREQPMERLMPLEFGGDWVQVPTTGMHVARQVTAALIRRFRHGIRLTFSEHGTMLEWLDPQPAR